MTAVSYSWPLERAWDRVRDMLFRRFDIEKWLVLGFAAFLSGLVDFGFGSGIKLRWAGPFRYDRWVDVPVLGLWTGGADPGPGCWPGRSCCSARHSCS